MQSLLSLSDDPQSLRDASPSNIYEKSEGKFKINHIHSDSDSNSNSDDMQDDENESESKSSE